MHKFSHKHHNLESLEPKESLESLESLEFSQIPQTPWIFPISRKHRLDLNSLRLLQFPLPSNTSFASIYNLTHNSTELPCIWISLYSLNLSPWLQ